MGVDLHTSRATVGFEVSGAAFTLAHSVALRSRAPTADAAPSAAHPALPANEVPPVIPSRAWRSRTYLLWEPGIPIIPGGTDHAFAWPAVGGTLGMRWDEFEDRTTRLKFTGGAWLGAGKVLSGRSNTEQCSSDETRPYAILVLGVRGAELYVSPKIGVLSAPEFCLGLGGASFK